MRRRIRSRFEKISMERGIVKSRRIEFIAPFDGRADDVLKSLGISTSIRTDLRKKKGLVAKICQDGETPLILVDTLKKGERFCIYLEDTLMPHVPVCDRDINIVYEDEDLAVVDKPASLAVIPVKNHYGRSLANCLAKRWGDFVYRPVNRLDRDTSGLMIVAKNSLAHSRLSGNTERRYLALCQGIFSGEKEGVIDAPIARAEDGMKRYVCERGKGVEAVTRYKFLRQYDGYFLAQFIPVTGRTHQIRVHSASIGYPLVCDRLYNPDCKALTLGEGRLLDRQALHSYYLEFTHPISGEWLCFSSVPDFLTSGDYDKIIREIHYDGR